MTRIVLTTVAITLGVMVNLAPASAGALDRIEDRIDRRENIRDEAFDRGPIDVIEDKLDRIEDRRDRRGLARPSAIDRHERRSWTRLWGGNGGE